LNYQPDIAGERLKGQVTNMVKLTSGRFAIVQKGKEFSLVPWQNNILQKQGKGLVIGKTRTISR